MTDFYALARPLLFKVPPEDAHKLTIKAMKMGIFPKVKPVIDPALESTLWGLKFPNPVGMAAGFDKNAEAIGPLFNLGFGFVEVGTVTPKPQRGNPSPRIFRCPEHEAVINRMGFPNGGMSAFKDNLTKFLGRKEHPAGVLGINIGLNKSQIYPAKDYQILIKMLAPMADYLTINVSCPNQKGVTDLQKRGPLLELLSVVKEERKKSCGDHPPPLLLKLSPDLDDAQIEELAQTALDAKIDGLILTNTTLDRPNYLPKSFANEKGGLSGKPVAEKSTETIRKFYTQTKGQIPIIGTGGISSGAQAYAKIRAGASLVQLYTGLVYKGPNVAHFVNSKLLTLLQKDGFSNITQAIGIDAKTGGKEKAKALDAAQST